MQWIALWLYMFGCIEILLARRKHKERVAIRFWGTVLWPIIVPLAVFVVLAGEKEL